MKISEIVNEGWQGALAGGAIGGLLGGLPGAAIGAYAGHAIQHSAVNAARKNAESLKQLTQNQYTDALRKVDPKTTETAKKANIDPVLLQLYVDGAMGSYKRYKVSPAGSTAFEKWFLHKFKRSVDRSNDEDYFNNIDDYREEKAEQPVEEDATPESIAQINKLTRR